MKEPNYTTDDEISFAEIFDFLRDGWKTLALTTILGCGIGVVVGYVLPEKYLASVSVVPAQVAGKVVEDVNVLAEKMRSPTFYSEKTLKICGTEDAQLLLRALNWSVRNPLNDLSLSFKSSSPEISAACLNSVLADINKNQTDLKSSALEEIQEKLGKLREEMAYKATKARDELSFYQKKISSKKEQLNNLQNVLATLESSIVKNDGSSIDTLLYLSLWLNLEKEAEIELALHESEHEARLSESEYNDNMRVWRQQMGSFEKDMLPPATEAATFTTEVYAPNIPVEPRRTLIAAIALLLGMLGGAVLLVVRRFLRA